MAVQILQILEDVYAGILSKINLVVRHLQLIFSFKKLTYKKEPLLYQSFVKVYVNFCTKSFENKTYYYYIGF